jgi:hypothetical protein
MATRDMVYELRERTGAGIYDCKRAFDITDGDIDEAAYFLITGKNPIYYVIQNNKGLPGVFSFEFIVDKKDIALDYCKKNRSARCYKHSLLKDDIQEIEVE